MSVIIIMSITLPVDRDY